MFRDFKEVHKAKGAEYLDAEAKDAAARARIQQLRNQNTLGGLKLYDSFTGEDTPIRDFFFGEKEVKPTTANTHQVKEGISEGLRDSGLFQPTPEPVSGMGKFDLGTGSFAPTGGETMSFGSGTVPADLATQQAAQQAAAQQVAAAETAGTTAGGGGAASVNPAGWIMAAIAANETDARTGDYGSRDHDWGTEGDLKQHYSGDSMQQDLGRWGQRAGLSKDDSKTAAAVVSPISWALRETLRGLGIS